MPMHEIHKLYEYVVDGPGPVEDSFTVENGVQAFKAVRLTSDNEQALYAGGGGFFLEVQDRELFPREFDPRLLMSGVEVPGTARFYPLLTDECGQAVAIERTTGKLRFEYRHHGFTTPYRLIIHLVGLTDRFS